MKPSATIPPMPRGGARPNAGRKRRTTAKPTTLCFQAPPDLVRAFEAYRDRMAPGGALGPVLRGLAVLGLEAVAPDLAPAREHKD